MASPAYAGEAIFTLFRTAENQFLYKGVYKRSGHKLQFNGPNPQMV